MEENIGKRILWRHKKPRDRFYKVQVHMGIVKEVSPSGKYVCVEATDRPIPYEDKILYDSMWLPVDSVEILEILD